jgi:hypothetical protein
MTIVFAVLIVSGAQIFSLFAGYHLITRYFERKQAEITLAAQSEIMALSKGEPSQTATILMAIGQTVGREAGKSAKHALLNDLANAKRATNDAIDDGIVGAVAARQPALGSMLAGMGRNQRKGLLGNPLIQLALQGLTGAGAGAGGVPAPTNGGEYTGRKHRE